MDANDASGPLTERERIRLLELRVNAVETILDKHVTSCNQRAEVRLQLEQSRHRELKGSINRLVIGVLIALAGILITLALKNL